MTRPTVPSNAASTRASLARRLGRSWGAAAVIAAFLAAAPRAIDREAVRAAWTRPPALAGTWYPKGRARLVSAARFLMRVATPSPALSARPVALVVPHAGWSYSGAAAATAFRQLRPGEFDRVVLMGPSHQSAFSGYALEDAGAYQTPLGDVPLCEGVEDSLASQDARIVPGVTTPEHSVEIELPFLQTALGRFCLVPILVGETGAAEEKAFAKRLAPLDDGKTLFVFSSDFAHYGPRFDYSPFGALSPSTVERIREMDRRGVALLSGGDAAGFRSYLQETGTTICGRNGLATLLELLPLVAPGARGVLLAHYLSADLPGMKDDSSVSYVAMAFVRPDRGRGASAGTASGPPLTAMPRLESVREDAPPVSEEEGARLVRLARAALVSELRGTDDLDRVLAEWPTGPDEERRQGVFVTLDRKDPDAIRRLGRLRGCIGQPEPTFPLYYGTVQAALDAALRDPRFEPVTADELPGLHVEVTVLSPRHSVASWRDIRIGTHGIVLEKGGKAALFLPQVAPENHWTLEQTLDALAEKAGLPRDGWREGARFSVFTGQAFEEKS
jgi:AmmeMemoRadiSam system protein B/AmmeMemoRadiSam system protein A